jgi:hypothetical protein
MGGEALRRFRANLLDEGWSQLGHEIILLSWLIIAGSSFDP